MYQISLPQYMHVSVVLYVLILCELLREWRFSLFIKNAVENITLSRCKFLSYINLLQEFKFLASSWFILILKSNLFELLLLKVIAAETFFFCFLQSLLDWLIVRLKTGSSLLYFIRLIHESIMCTSFQYLLDLISNLMRSYIF